MREPLAPALVAAIERRMSSLYQAVAGISVKHYPVERRPDEGGGRHAWDFLLYHFFTDDDELMSLVQVSSRIREDLLQRAGEFNIKLEDVSITHLTFGKVR